MALALSAESDECYILHPTFWAWKVPLMDGQAPDGRHGHFCFPHPNGAVLFGGCAGGKRFFDVYVLDMVTAGAGRGRRSSLGRAETRQVVCGRVSGRATGGVHGIAEGSGGQRKATEWEANRRR